MKSLVTLIEIFTLASSSLWDNFPLVVHMLGSFSSSNLSYNTTWLVRPSQITPCKVFFTWKSPLKIHSFYHRILLCYFILLFFILNFSIHFVHILSFILLCNVNLNSSSNPNGNGIHESKAHICQINDSISST